MYAIAGKNIVTRQSDHCRISVVMCSLNEREAIEYVVHRIRAVIGDDNEIILTDSSSDGTAQIAEMLAVNVIRQTPPQGYGLAMKAGLAAAKGETIVTMDCDNTYPACRIMDIVRLIEKGEADVVGATRMTRYPKTMPYINFLANKFFAFLTRLLIGIKVTDVTTGMRAYRRDVLKKVEWDTEFVLPISLLASAWFHGAKYREVSIEYGHRLGSVTLDRLRSGLASLIYILVRRWWRPKWFRASCQKC